MSFTDIPTESQATVFTWLADKALGGFKKAFGWGWDRVQWAKAQDRYDQQIIDDHSRIRILGQTGSKLLIEALTT
ncbi:MAG: hypothetical protein JXA42_01250 [Anaerolineales bacterium]|nr:hypothetical protein [Anaerolineales bacterium]